MQQEIRIIPINHIPEITKGDDLAGIIQQTLQKQQLALEPNDILIVTQKVVSKAEGREVDLTMVKPSLFAQNYARTYEKDPRYVEVILQESNRIVRMDHGVMICETKQGFICANAGVDASNIKTRETVSLLPKDANISAKNILQAIKKTMEVNIAVVISDTWGRPWREGQVNFAIGTAGIDPLIDYRGGKDVYGKELQASIIAIADELAGAAELVMQKADKVPVAIIRGYQYVTTGKDEATLLRDPKMDLFR